jgi:presenilin-like A22 family membrane protease
VGQALNYGSALGWTLLIEVPIYVSGLQWRRRLNLKRALIAAVAINLASHLLAFLVVLPILEFVVGRFVGVVVVEAAIVFFEAILLWCYWRVECRFAVALSLIANCVSLLFGIALLR